MNWTATKSKFLELNTELEERNAFMLVRFMDWLSLASSSTHWPPDNLCE